jgi:hypothetical protein
MTPQQIRVLETQMFGPLFATLGPDGHDRTYSPHADKQNWKEYGALALHQRFAGHPRSSWMRDQNLW